MITGEEWQVLFFTCWVSALATLLIIPPGLALAWLLARCEWRGKGFVETLVALPLVMPPVATGLILLKIFGRNGPVGGFLYETFGISLIFTWKAVTIALFVMSFPLFVRSVRVALEQVNPRLEQIAQTLGASPWRVFWRITLPLSVRGIVAGTILAFARALGEFGATIMIAGNIQGKTSTLSLSIYQSVQMGHDNLAYKYLGIAVVIAFLAIWTSEFLLRKRKVG